ncbi:hypothetical protein FOZ62_029072 [Perkinsus olseni]|uniref:Protein kinase domain-containing protein n=2 Tax=Perkinsus olseni TaxID=32597 RepID=A0A7J6SIN7_PEROL|nr:hypothetical protein FOZ62_029072 [Perkinsus olseni]
MKSGPSEASQLFEQWLKQRTMSTIHPPCCHLEWVHRKELYGEGIKKVSFSARARDLCCFMGAFDASEQQRSVQQKRGSRKRSVSFDPSASQGPHQKQDPCRWRPCPMTEREQNLLKLICLQYLPKDSPTLTPSVRLKIRRYLQYLMFVDSGFKDFVLCNSSNAAKLLENIGRLLAANGNQRRPVHKAVQIATSACVKIPVELQDSEAITVEMPVLDSVSVLFRDHAPPMTNLQRKITLRHLLQLAAVVIAALCLACKVVRVTSPSDPEVPEILLCVASYIILYKFCLGVDLFITQVLPTMLLFTGPLWCILLAGAVHALHIAVTIDPPSRLREALVLRLIEVALTIHITYVLRAFQPWPLLGLLGVAITSHWEDADLLCDVRQLFVCLGATCCDITLFVNAFGVAPVARRVRAAYVVSRLLVGMVLLLVSPQYVLTTAILLILYSTCQGWIVVVRPISVPLSEIKISDNKSHPADRCLLPFFEYQLRKRLAEEVEEIDTGLDAESDDEFEECVDPSVPFCIERFRERAELGKGEFGRCVWVFDVSSGREYALKYLNKSIYRRRGLTAKAAEELRIVSGISHQNVVTFYGAYETADTWAFVFEYCVHGDLAAYMSRNNPVNPIVALGMASRVLQAVNYLHELWIVYRDLKPANVVLDSNYDPKLCDFGLAIWRRSPDAKCRTFCGSAGYCAPEVRTGPEYDDKCDIFSWGALLWALVTGMQAHLHRSWPSTLSGTDAWFEGHLARFPPVDREGVREVLSMAAMANPTERPDSAFLCFGSPHVLRWQTYPCTV